MNRALIYSSPWDGTLGNVKIKDNNTYITYLFVPIISEIEKVSYDTHLIVYMANYKYSLNCCRIILPKLCVLTLVVIKIIS